MSETPAISFANVNKRFLFTADKPQTILEAIVAVFQRRQPQQPLWAVRDVTFDVLRGQSLGIVGRNGSGKSTVLKLAARILRPSAGVVAVHGRISALLELGAGFHPDLSGRENIYLNGSVLGLNKRELDSRFDSIVAFSELAEFIDMPVKHYSSGMYMRLGFSVAVHVDPDILIVDEILAVGDYAFQTKCLERIREMQRQGVTIVMVSHQLQTIRNLCTHAIWMDHGQVRAHGQSSSVLAAYLGHFEVKRGGLAGAAVGTPFRRWGTGEVEITGVRFVDGVGKTCHEFQTGHPFGVEIHYMAHEAVRDPEFGLAIFHQDGTHILGPNTRLAGVKMGVVQGAGVVRYALQRLPLLPASYRMTAAVHDTQLPRAFDYHEEAYTFRVLPTGSEKPAGLVSLPAQWDWEPAA